MPFCEAVPPLYVVRAAVAAFAPIVKVLKVELNVKDVIVCAV